MRILFLVLCLFFSVQKAADAITFGTVFSDCQKWQESNYEFDPSNPDMLASAMACMGVMASWKYAAHSNCELDRQSDIPDEIENFLAFGLFDDNISLPELSDILIIYAQNHPDDFDYYLPTIAPFITNGVLLCSK